MSEMTGPYAGVNDFIKANFCDNEKDAMVASEASISRYAKRIYTMLEVHEPKLFAQLQRLYRTEERVRFRIRVVLRRRRDEAAKSRKLEGMVAA